MDTGQLTLQITPNPSNGVFKLRCNVPRRGYNASRGYTEYHIIVYNILGQIVTKIDFDGFNGNNEHVVFSNLTTGIYFAKIYTRYNTYTAKFLIIK